MSNAPKRVGIYDRPAKSANRFQLPLRIGIAVLLLVIALFYYFLRK